MKNEKASPETAHNPHHELLRAIRLCHPGWETPRKLTLAASGQAPAQWREKIWQPVLRPQLEAARAAAATGDLKALSACDRALERELPEKCREASRRPGRALLADYTAPPAEKGWRRYAKLASDDQTPGHLAIAVAVRAAAFHLAPAATLSGYLFLEAQGGLPDGDFPRWVKMIDECLAGGGNTFALRAA